MKIKGMLIDVQNETAKVVEVEKKLESYYDILKCDTIDIVERKIGGQLFDIVADDEGLFNQPKISAINDMGEPMLVGNLFIVNYDGKGDITSLEENDIQHLQNFVEIMYTKQYPEGYPMVVQMEY